MPGSAYVSHRTTSVPVSLQTVLDAIDSVLSKLGAVVVFTGTTTANGNVGGTTLVCGDLAAEPDYDGDICVILSGTYAKQSRVISGATTGGTVTVGTAFGGRIPIDVEFAILSLKAGGGGGTVLPTVAGSTTGNWQTAETDLVTIGANGTSYKLHQLIVDISNLVGNISIRTYHRVNGVERRQFPIPAAATFTAAASAPSIPIWDTSGAITEALRVTVQSDAAADNGAAVSYQYKLEEM